MDKSKNFKDANKKILTYMDVVKMFNELNETLHGEYYAYSSKLKRPEGGQAVGFVYTGYAAGIGLNRILDKIGIKYSTFMKSGSGINEESEIHIDVKDEKKMLNIIEKIGDVKSNLQTQIDVTNSNFANNPLFQQIR